MQTLKAGCKLWAEIRTTARSDFADRRSTVAVEVLADRSVEFAVDRLSNALNTHRRIVLLVSRHLVASTGAASDDVSDHVTHGARTRDPSPATEDNRPGQRKNRKPVLLIRWLRNVPE